MTRQASAVAVLWALTSSASAWSRESSPPSPDHAWAPPDLQNYEIELAHGAARENAAPTVAIAPGKVYDLPALIDIAQRSHPETRLAWEQARQAAEAVGLGQSAYFPYLAASAASGYDRAFIPFPSLRVNQRQLARQIEQATANPAAALRRLETSGVTSPNVSIDGGGTLTTDALVSRTAVSLKWLLLDFGERAAGVAAAKERLVMANVGFNAAHQKVVYEVTRNFYAFNIAREKVSVAQSAVDSARVVEQSARARRQQGLATEPEVLQANEQTAQADFDLEAARGAASNAQVDLVESLGIPPTTGLQVARVSDQPVSTKLETTLDGLIDRALSQRPDLVAKLANVRACRAEIRKARAEYLPKVALDAHAGWADLEVSAEGSPYFGGNEPVYGVGIAVELPLFDGFARDRKLKIAESELRAAESELALARDQAVRDVWKAYTDLQTAVRKQDSAARLQTAAESASAAVLDAYRHGLKNYIDVATAQSRLVAARNIGIETRAAIFTSAAALALTVGELARPLPSPPTTRRKP